VEVYDDSRGDISGLASCPSDDNYFYVSATTAHRVLKIKLETGGYDFWSVQGARGLSINRLRNVLVASEYSIVEYTSAGSQLRQVRLNSYLYLWHAVEHINGTLVVSLVGPFHGVYLLSVDGRVLQSYGSTTQWSCRTDERTT
jgi:hypothetical protein